MSQEDAAAPQDAPEAPAAAESTPAAPEPKVFDEDYVKQLRSEAARYRTEAQEAKGRLSEREEAEKSELERAQGKLAKAEQRAAQAETELIRFQIASEKGVPAEAVEFLTGSSREELEASADKILSLVTKPATPDFDGGAREPAPDPETPEEGFNRSILEVLGMNT